MLNRRFLITATALGALTLGACSNSDPLSGPSTSPADEGSAAATGPIVVGSQDYYSNEIIAEIYAQALENAGYTVERNFRIGQREAYVPEIEAGKIDLFPEYSGPLLQYWQPDPEERLSDEVYAALKEATPEGLRILQQSEATDQDSYTVTKEYAEKWDLATLDDLKNVTEPLTLGANSEAENRPNGPKGLKDTYDVDVAFTPIEDGGGPVTVKALKDNQIQLAIIYTADPSIAENDLVSLEDTQGLFLASHVVPLVSDDIDEAAAQVIDVVSGTMSAEDLIELNQRSVSEELPAATIATDWLKEKKLI